MEWLNDAGFRTFELAASIKGIDDLVSELSSDVGLDIGVGMVTDGHQASTCIEAGASYIASPGIVSEIVVPCRQAGVVCLLGASTPSEVLRAVELGADGVKVFPVNCLGGAPYIKTLNAVFADVPLAPAGGIEIDQIAPYLKAGAAFIGIGRKLVDAKALCSGDKDAIIDAAANALEQVAATRTPPRDKRR